MNNKQKKEFLDMLEPEAKEALLEHEASAFYLESKKELKKQKREHEKAEKAYQDYMSELKSKSLADFSKKKVSAQLNRLFKGL